MIDLHCHLLPGVDDGVGSLEEARALARAAAAEGVTAIAATPHVRADHPTAPERMEAGVAELRDDFAREGIAVEVLYGGEIDLERLALLPAGDLRRFSYGQAGRYILLEFPYWGWPLALDSVVRRLAGEGITPLLAHPERNGEVQAAPERLGGLVAAGALVQLTAASVDGRLGRSPREASERILRLGLAHVLASDAHHPSVREAGLAAAAAAVGDAALARYLTFEAPAAIVAGEPVPPLPAAPPRRRFFR